MRMPMTVLSLLLAVGLAFGGQSDGKGKPDKGDPPEHGRPFKKLWVPNPFTCALEGDSLVLNWGAVEGAAGYRVVVQAVVDDDDLEGAYVERETAALTLTVPLADLAAPGAPLPAQVQARVQGMRDAAVEPGKRPKAHGRGMGRHSKWCKAPADVDRD
jgi:hypothetical protein